jgi:hypothetical protein
MANTAAPKETPAYELFIFLELGRGEYAKRALVVGANTTFKRLHEAIQAAYCWQGYHLHKFMLFKKDWQDDPEVEIIPDKALKEATSAPVVRLAHRAKLSAFLDDYNYLLYVYNFGDEWLHVIKVGKFLSDYKGGLPSLVLGENDAPPEDCGGAAGWAELRKIMGSPRHKEHKEAMRWAKERGWEPYDFEKTSLRVFLAGKPQRSGGVWVREDV